MRIANSGQDVARWGKSRKTKLEARISNIPRIPASSAGRRIAAHGLRLLPEQHERRRDHEVSEYRRKHEGPPDEESGGPITQPFGAEYEERAEARSDPPATTTPR